MNRMAIAQNTLEILEAGYYISPNGDRVDLAGELQVCLDETGYYEPDTLSKIEREVLASTPKFSNTEFDVRNETTLVGAERTARTGKFEKIGVLNFASAKNPGGGFLRGAQAQEESLARSSALYRSLLIRGSKLLSLADRRGCDALVLGAWGCGVFQNDPSVVAQMFADLLLPTGQFWGRFNSVLFSVLDSSQHQKIWAEFQQ